MKKHATQRGDTLIEVLLSLAVLSLIIVGGNAFMNFGMKNAITAVEHTQVRNLVVGQAELLRYMRDNAGSGTDPVSVAWRDILAPPRNNSDDASPIQSCSAGSGAFYLTAGLASSSPGKPAINVNNYTWNGTTDSDNLPYATPGEGLWIEAVEEYGSAQNYIDFHIRACWTGIGTSVKQQTSTVVRLRTE